MINQELNKLTDCLIQQNEYSNIAKSERILSLATGSFILLNGIGNIFSHPLLALVEVSIGAGLIYRGSTGYCAVKDALYNDIDGENEPFTFVEEYVVKPL